MHTDDDTLISSYIDAATREAENITGRQFITLDYELKTDNLYMTSNGQLVIPKPPLISITSFDYYDESGNPQTLVEGTDFRVLSPQEGLTLLEPVDTWPSVAARSDAVTVKFDAGYGPNMTDVPETIRQAVRLLTGSYWTNRDDSVRADRYSQAAAAERLLFQYSVQDRYVYEALVV